MTNPVRIMIDLETMSSEKTAAILSIGAVVFMNGMPVNDSPFFYTRIAPEFASQFGHVDKATMEWWDKQDPAVRAEAFGGVRNFLPCMLDFYSWVKLQAYHANVDLNEVELWSRGADFDLAILQHAYQHVDDGDYPFNFRKHMCERTVRNLVPAELLSIADAERKPGTAHNALEDAKNQAHYMNHALAWLKVNHGNS